MMYITEEEKREAPSPVSASTISRFVNQTSDNLREADAILNDITVCLLGPGKETRPDRPKAECLLDALGQTAENSALLTERLLKLRDVIIG